MINFGILRSECTGCAACENICEKDAIQMQRGLDGFEYPVVNEEKCVQCMKCIKVCTLRKSKPENSLQFPLVYGMYSKNDKLRIHSTSGGIFSELAEYVLRSGGYVAGAVYKADWSVEHRMIQDIEGLEDLRRSKYQQSSVNLIYRDVKRVLEEGKEVLFCGTPCQVGGLKAFLGREYNRLIACDFICRGVSSPRIFAEYIRELEDEYGSRVEYIWMKNKCNGWHSLTTVIGFQNGESYVRKGMEDSYVQLYLRYNAGVRDSCYQCSFKGENDVADITLGDFWGLDGTALDDDRGISAVICRTEKGRTLVDGIKGKVRYEEKQIDDVKRGNPCLCKSIEKKIQNMDTFYNVLEREGYRQAVEWIAEKRR